MAAPTNAADVKKTLANPEPSIHGPTPTFCGIIAYVGCLRTSRLVMLAASFSESDPTRTSRVRLRRHLP
jgi:hypothetical protein